MGTIDRVKQRLVLAGLDAALGIASTSRVYKKKVNGATEFRFVSIDCSEPSQEFCRWFLRLLPDRIVELNYVDEISNQSVRKV